MPVFLYAWLSCMFTMKYGLHVVLGEVLLTEIEFT